MQFLADMISQWEKLESLNALLFDSRYKVASIDQIHGMLTSSVCGPKVVKVGRWLPFVFPKTKDFKKLIAKPFIESVVMTMIDIYNDLLFSIRQATFVPYFGRFNLKAKTLKQARGWCEGFFYGISLHDREWLENDSTELASLTAPIFYMANPEAFSKELGKEKVRKFKEQQEELIESIRYNVPQIYDYWNIGVKPEIKKDLLRLDEDSNSKE